MGCRVSGGQVDRCEPDRRGERGAYGALGLALGLTAAFFTGAEAWGDAFAWGAREGSGSWGASEGSGMGQPVMGSRGIAVTGEGWPEPELSVGELPRNRPPTPAR